MHRVLLLLASFLLTSQRVIFAARSHLFVDNLEDCQVGAELWSEEEPESSPLVSCNQLDAQWFECEDISLVQVENSTNKDSSICPYFGEKNGVVAHANVTCRILPCIECLGSREFQLEVPCLKYTGHYFISTFLYSVFLGVLAADRFYLGYSAIGVGKLMTLGGLGIWWIADILLLLLGSLKPADESEWEPWQPY